MLLTASFFFSIVKEIEEKWKVVEMGTLPPTCGVALVLLLDFFLFDSSRGKWEEKGEVEIRAYLGPTGLLWLYR